MWDPLSDCRPLISAAASGKFRLVRMLVEGGAEVNRCNRDGETALLAACKALRGEPAGPETVKLLTYLLQNKADPNAQDHCGRTALMYACMERAGAQVASTLLAAGADPSMEDQSGASALVYAINAQHQPTLQVLMDACQARGRDIIIIVTETGVNGGPVTRRYLNVVPSPDSSPVSCMSPSDIILKTGSSCSPEGENIFNFNRPAGQRGSGILRRPPSCEPSPFSLPPAARQRVLSEPWLSIDNLACLNRAYEEAIRERSVKNEADREEPQEKGDGYGKENFSPRVSQSLLSLADITSSQATMRRLLPEMAGGATSAKKTSDNLPSCPSSPSSLRRHTLPSVTVVPPPLHLPPLAHKSDPHLQAPPCKSRSMVYLPHPPSSSPPSSSPSRAAVRLPPLQVASSITSLDAASASRFDRLSARRHSVQLEEIRGRDTI